MQFLAVRGNVSIGVGGLELPIATPLGCLSSNNFLCPLYQGRIKVFDNKKIFCSFPFFFFVKIQCFF